MCYVGWRGFDEIQRVARLTTRRRRASR